MRSHFQSSATSFTECAGVLWLQHSATLSGVTVARLHEALLPMLLLPRVRVRGLEARGLSAIEMFLLKSLLRHGKLNLDGVAMATGIPSGPLQVLLHGLVRQGILSTRDGNFTAIRDAAEKAVATGVCPETVESTKDFIFLPRTGDLGVLSDANFKKLTGLRPHCQAPVPQEIVGARIASVLVNTPSCSRYGWEILGVEEPAIMPKQCPAYSCSGELVNSEHPQLWLSFAQADRRRSSHDFSFADALVKELIRFASVSPPIEHISEATRFLLRKHGAPYPLASPEITAPGRVSMPMPRSVIERLMPGELLVTPAAIAARWESPAAVASIQYEVRFKPTSARDAVSFATDKVVQQICTCDGNPNPSLSAWIEDACNEFETSSSEITMRQIANRTWALGEFTRAYTLHEEEVFHYDQSHRHRQH